MSQINFKSTIRPVTSQQYLKEVLAISNNNSVNYPWTINDTVSAKDTYTVGICDCTAGVVTNRKSSVMFHLSPRNDYNKNLQDVLKKMKYTIKEKLCEEKDKTDTFKNENLQAIVIGSKDDECSKKFYNNIINFFIELNIPTTELKNGTKSTDIAYLGSKDEFIVTSEDIERAIYSNKTNQEVLSCSFKNILLADCDQIV